MADPVRSAVEDMFRIAAPDESKMRAAEMRPEQAPEPTINERVEQQLAPFRQGGAEPGPAVRQGAIQSAIGQSPEARAALAGAALTAPMMAAPMALGVAAPSVGEFFTAMGLGGLSAAGGEAVRQHGGPVLGKYTEPAAMAVEMMTPLGAELTAARIAPRAAAETKALARQAEKEGFKISPRQVSHTPEPTFTEHNAVQANRMMSRPTGLMVDKFDKKFFEDRAKFFRDGYNRIYSEQNQFTIPPQGRQDIATTWNDLKAMPHAPPSIVKAIENRGAAVLNPAYGGLTNGAEIKGILDELEPIAAKINKPEMHDIADQAIKLRKLLRSNFTPANPQIQAELADLNKKFGPFALLRDMQADNKLVNMNVDLQEVNKRLLDLAKFREGKMTGDQAKAAEIGAGLNVRPKPPAEKRDTLGRTLGAGAGAATGYGASTLMGGGPVESGLAALVGAKSADALGKGVGKALDVGLDPLGRFMQRISRPQLEDLERRGLLAQLLGRTRVPAAAVGAGQATQTGEQNGP